MNFLLRSAPTAASVQPPVNDFPVDMDHMSKKPATTLEGLIAEDPCSQRSATEDCDKETDGVGPNANEELHIIEKHSDVTEDEGWITIPYSIPSSFIQISLHFSSSSISYMHLVYRFALVAVQLHLINLVAKANVWIIEDSSCYVRVNMEWNQANYYLPH